MPACGSKRKGGQVRFTPQQTQSLERRFANHKYLSPEDRRHLALQLKLSDRQVSKRTCFPYVSHMFHVINSLLFQVKTWFQNRRAKWRRSNNISNPSNNIGISHSSMLPSSSGARSEDSGGSEDEDTPPLNLHINQHSNLYKYNNQFTVAKKRHYKKGVHQRHAASTAAGAGGQRHSTTSDEGEDNDRSDDNTDRPDTPIQVA